MKKRIFLGLLPITVFAILALLADKEAVAASCGADQSSLFLRNSDGTDTQTTYYIRFAGVNEVTVSGIKKYKWIYNINSSIPNSEYDILVPACNPPCNVLVTYTIDSPSVVKVPGLGDKNTGFGVGDYQAQTIVMPASSVSGNSIYFYTDVYTNPVATSMQVKAGRNLYFVKDIKGPSCPLQENFIPVNNVEDKTLGEFLVRIFKDRGTWCASSIEYCKPSTSDCGPTGDGWIQSLPTTGTINGQTLVSCGSADGNQRCQECIVYGTSSPGCYTYTSGGRTYKIPTGCQ